MNLSVKKRAFTLIELLIFMGILSVMLLVLTQVFVSILDSRIESESLSSVEQDGNFIVSRLMSDIERSTAINIPSAPGNHGSTLQIVAGGVTNTYTLNNGLLQLTNTNGTDQLNGYDTRVSNLDFKRIGGGGATDSIQISMTITSLVVGHAGPQIKTYQITAAAR